MKRKPNYYVVVCNDGFITHTNTYQLALDVMDDHRGGFCKGAMNLAEVEQYKESYATKPATQKALRDEYRRLMDDYMSGRGVQRAIEKRLMELAKLGVSD